MHADQISIWTSQPYSYRPKLYSDGPLNALAHSRSPGPLSSYPTRGFDQRSATLRTTHTDYLYSYLHQFVLYQSRRQEAQRPARRFKNVNISVCSHLSDLRAKIITELKLVYADTRKVDGWMARVIHKRAKKKPLLHRPKWRYELFIRLSLE